MWSNVFKNSIYGNSGILLLGLTVLVSVVYLLLNRRKRKLPPGPIGLPIVGYLPFLRKNPVEKLAQLAKKYGNVVGLYLGPKYVVFLNDWAAVKDALGQDTTLDRPEAAFDEVPWKFGVAGVNGSEWVESRRLASKVMKDGLQKNHWEDLIQDELTDIIDQIKQEGEKTIDVRNFFRDSFSNLVVSLLIGERLDTGHSVTKMVSQSVDYIMEFTRILDMVNFSKLLAKLFRIFGLDQTPDIGQKTGKFFQFVSNTVDSNAQNPIPEKDTFISRFQTEIDNRKKAKQTSHVTEESLKGTVVALMVGGSETTRTSILWTLIAMAEHPDIQRKVHEELDREIGREKSVRWSDRNKVPYTLATLMEGLRWRTTVPIPGMRITTKDTEIQGYHVPKGTFIGTNNWCLHNDQRYWKNPDQFNPERFLLEDGKKVNMAIESFNAFSYGKRNCPGKLLAYMDMLQYFSTLMQKFRVEPKEGSKLKYDEILGLSFQARNAELRFIPR